MSKDFFKKVGIGLGAFLTPLSALAIDAINPRTTIMPELLIENIVGWLAWAVLAVAVIMLLYAAFMFVLGAAIPDNQTKAKDALIYAIIGIVVALLAFSILPLIRRIIFG